MVNRFSDETMLLRSDLSSFVTAVEVDILEALLADGGDANFE